MKLWTMISDYSATGEGRTVTGLITYAEDQQNAELRWAEQEKYYIPDIVEEGVPISNQYLTFLFSAAALKFAVENEGKANINMLSRIHYNYS